MAKFNVVQKKRRALISDRKRATHGDPVTGKLKQKAQPLSISGKRKRKLFKKWRKEQKEGIGKDLVTMEDVEMTVAEGTSADASKQTAQFSLKKSKKLKVKQLKRRGKNQQKSHKPTAENPADAMVE